MKKANELLLIMSSVFLCFGCANTKEDFKCINYKLPSKNIIINEEFYPFKELEFTDNPNFDDYYLYTEAYYVDVTDVLHGRSKTYSTGTDVYIIPDNLPSYQLYMHFVEKETLKYCFCYSIVLEVYNE